MNEKIHFVRLMKKCLKDNVKTAHWVGRSQLRSLDTYDFLKITRVVDEKQASVTGNTMKQSVYVEKKNPDLMQQEEENVAEETTEDADVNAEANEVDDNNKDMVVTMKYDRKNLEYQEKMNVDIEKIASKKNHLGDQYMKLLKIHILKKQDYFQQMF